MIIFLRNLFFIEKKSKVSKVDIFSILGRIRIHIKMKRIRNTEKNYQLSLLINISQVLLCFRTESEHHVTASAIVSFKIN